MKNTEEEITRLAIKIGVTVAIFLLNNGLALKAIGLCLESLILLTKDDLSTDSPVAKSFDELIKCNHVGLVVQVKKKWMSGVGQEKR